jgi:hypothetical protein
MKDSVARQARRPSADAAGLPARVIHVVSRVPDLAVADGRVVRQALERSAALIGLRWVVTGDRDRSSHAVAAGAQNLREHLLTGVHALVTLALDGTTPSTEDVIAGRIGMPHLRALRGEGWRDAPHAADGAALRSEGRYRDPAELEQLVFDWARAHAADVLAYPRRRASVLAAAGPRRTRDLRRWEALSADDQRVVAASVALTPRQVMRRLVSDAEYADVATGTTVRLRDELERRVPSHRFAPAGESADRLSARQRQAFESAVATWRWDPAFADAVLARGLEMLAEDRALVAAAEPSRFPRLESRFGWLDIARKLCGPPPS